MALLAFNMTTSPLALAVGGVTLPASSTAGVRGKAVNVTSELRVDLLVDPNGGVLGGRTAANLIALQAQVAAGLVEYEWNGEAEYLTPQLRWMCLEMFHNAALWVSPEGDDVTGDGTIGNPWKTIQYAIDRSPNSGVICLHPGHYSSATAPIVDKVLWMVGFGPEQSRIEVTGVGQPALCVCNGIRPGVNGVDAFLAAGPAAYLTNAPLIPTNGVMAVAYLIDLQLYSRAPGAGEWGMVVVDTSAPPGSQVWSVVWRCDISSSSNDNLAWLWGGVGFSAEQINMENAGISAYPDATDVRPCTIDLRNCQILEVELLGAPSAPHVCGLDFSRIKNEIRSVSGSMANITARESYLGALMLLGTDVANVRGCFIEGPHTVSDGSTSNLYDTHVEGQATYENTGAGPYAACLAHGCTFGAVPIDAAVPARLTGSTTFAGDVRVTGKLTVDGSVDPTDITLEQSPTPPTAATQGALFVSDGTGGLNVGRPYFVPASDGVPEELIGGGGAGTLEETLDLGNTTGGSDISITPGDTIVSPAGQELPIHAGDDLAEAGVGGNVTISAGDAGITGVGGNVTISAGDTGDDGQGGSIDLNPGAASGGELGMNGRVNVNGNLTVTGNATIDGLIQNPTGVVFEEMPAGTPSTSATQGAIFVSDGGAGLDQGDLYFVPPNTAPAIKLSGGGGGASPSNTIFVAKNGNDLTGDGTFGKPFASIQKGVDDLGASAGVVFIYPGVYDETVVVREDNVRLVGVIGKGYQDGNTVQIRPASGPSLVLTNADDDAAWAAFLAGGPANYDTNFAALAAGLTTPQDFQALAVEFYPQTSVDYPLLVVGVGAGNSVCLVEGRFAGCSLRNDDDSLSIWARLANTIRLEEGCLLPGAINTHNITNLWASNSQIGDVNMFYSTSEDEPSDTDNWGLNGHFVSRGWITLTGEACGGRDQLMDCHFEQGITLDDDARLFLQHGHIANDLELLSSTAEFRLQDVLIGSDLILAAGLGGDCFLNGGGVMQDITDPNDRVIWTPPKPWASDTTPLVESGSGAAGVEPFFSREDHVHPASSPAFSGFVPMKSSGNDFNIAWVNPAATGAADDGSLLTPKLTIQGAINSFPAPLNAQDNLRRCVILVAPGKYDESLVLGPGRIWELLALGPVTLGDGILTNFDSTVSRNVTLQTDSTFEFTTVPPPVPLSNAARPHLFLGTLTWGGEGGSTHSAYSSSWRVSGQIRVISTGGTGTTAEIHLASVDCGGIDSSAGYGGINCYWYQCRFRGAVIMGPGTTPPMGYGQVILAKSCRFDSVAVVRYFDRVVECRFDAGLTVDAVPAGNLRPKGYFNTYLSGTLTGVAACLVADLATYKMAIDNAVVLAGGASWVPVAPLGAAAPAALGVANAGTSLSISREDHVHPLGSVASSILPNFGDPIGVENQTDSTISFNPVGRLFTIAPTGASWSYWTGPGGKVTKTISESISIANTPGVHYIYYVGNVISESTTFPGFNTVLVAAINWSPGAGAAIAFADERHGVVMDYMTHGYLHMTVGTRFQSGLTAQQLTTGTGGANTDAQAALTGGTIWDEDLVVTITRAAVPAAPYQQELGLFPATPGLFPLYERVGAGTTNWTKNAATTFPVRSFNGVAGQRIGYNLDTAGVWSCADPGQSNYVAVWIVGTTGFTDPVIAIMGQRGDSTINAARTNNTWEAMALGNLVLPEMKLLFRLIYRTSTAYGNTIKAYIADVTDFRNVAPIAPGSYVATQHSSLGGLTVPNSHPAAAISADTTNFDGILSGTDTDVQLALDTVDEYARAGAWGPPVGTKDGQVYFDTGLKKPFWYNSGDATWYDAAGSSHP